VLQELNCLAEYQITDIKKTQLNTPLKTKSGITRASAVAQLTLIQIINLFRRLTQKKIN